MKKHQQDDRTKSSRVKQICQNFLVHSDFGLAHRLQEEEFAVHYDRNRQQSRETGLGVRTARVMEEEEKRDFLTKRFQTFHEKQSAEETDLALALQIHENTNQENNRTKHNVKSHRKSHVSSPEDTSSDEQLARILQEEEELLASAKNRSMHLSNKEKGRRSTIFDPPYS